MTDICLMQYRCKVCSKVFWGYAVVYYSKQYMEDNTVVITMRNPYGSYDETDIARFTDDGIPMIETKIIDNVHNCKTHTDNTIMESYL